MDFETKFKLLRATNPFTKPLINLESCIKDLARLKPEDKKEMQKTTVTVKREEYSISSVEVKRALCRVVGIPEHDYEQITLNKDGSANYVFETSSTSDHS